MSGSPRVLLISRDRALAGAVRKALTPLPEWYWVSVVEDADSVDFEEIDEPGLLLVDLEGGDDRGLEPLARLLWLSSTSRRPFPVVVLTEAYDPEQALALFRMGVTDVLGRDEHAEQLGDVIAALSVRRAGVTGATPGEASKAARKAAPRWSFPGTFSNS